MDKADEGILEQEPKSATERFRTHLQLRLGEMRENARRIGASSTYMESLDRSTQAVMAALAARRPVETADKAKPETQAQATQRTVGRTRNSAA